LADGAPTFRSTLVSFVDFPEKAVPTVAILKQAKIEYANVGQPRC
jgi:hypothetical protein